MMLQKHSLRKSLPPASRSSLLKTAVSRWLDGRVDRGVGSSELELLERRQLLAVGGGWTAGGLLGDYFANPDLSGGAAFSRRDVRVSFDWGTIVKPGGSISPGFRDVGVDGFSARWTGHLVGKFSETYTFKALADDALKLEIKPAGSETWTTVINQLTETPGGVSGQYALTAGAKYDVRVEFKEFTGTASAKLLWSSPSTPEEVIDPVTEVGFNVDDSWDQAFADIIKSARNNFEPLTGQPRPTQDANGWPVGDGAYVWQESLNQGLPLDPLTQGKITFSFKGRATISLIGNFQPGTLNSSYDSGTNTTTGSFISAQIGSNASYFNFRDTDRDGNYGADELPDKDGITELKLMRPASVGAAESYAPDVLFEEKFKQGMQGFTSLRVDLNNQNQESAWSSRTLPGYINQKTGKPNTRLYSAGTAVANGVSWEHKIMLANETGRDLFINIPMAATGWTTADTQSYVYKLAQLMKYGSDGVNPYTETVANPLYPPLNSNLNLYVELSNEYWNFAGDAFRQYFDLDAMVAADADAYLNGGVSPNGDPRARPDDFAIFNYDNRSTAKLSSGAYSSLGTWRKRKMILRIAQISEIFRDVFGNSDMPGTSANPRVRPIYQWQYEDANATASDALSFLDNYFNNANGQQNVPTPHAPSYFIWGGGGASYYGSVNQWGVTSQIPDPSFEDTVFPDGYTPNAVGTDWTFTGTSGIARNGSTSDDIPPGSYLPGDTTKTATAQMAYITGTASMERTFTIPATQNSNVYAISFKSVQHTALGTTVADGQRLYVYIDGVLANAKSFSQSNGYRPDAWTTSKTWISRVVPWTDSEYYQTLTFSAEAGSTHTVKIVGQIEGHTAFVESVRLSSVDQLFDSGMPAAGTFATGQTPAGAYKARLGIQADWAAAYGLKYVTYEGGWALGGDTGGSPLQNYAKYSDPRAATIASIAFNNFAQAGGVLNTLGTYSQWPTWSDNYTPPEEGLLDPSLYTLFQGQIGFLSGVPVPVDNGTALTGGTQIFNNADAKLKFNTPSTGTTVNPNGWLSWNLIVPVAGVYNVSVDASAGATLRVLVDGELIDLYPSADALTRGPATFELSPGLHSIRVMVVGTAVSVKSITIKPGQGALTGAALAVYELGGMAYNASVATPDSIAPSVNVGNITNGPGFRANSQSGFANGLLVAPLTTGPNANKFAQDLATAITRNEYQSFTITPTNSGSMSLSSMLINTWFQNTPTTRGMGLRYSLDGTNFTTINSFTGSAADAPTFNLTSVAALQNRTGSVTFRIYLFGGNTFTSVGIGNRSGNDVMIYGSVVSPFSGSIAGQVWEDRNSNGAINAGEPTQNGVTVYLDANNNSAMDASEARVVSSGTGNYAFNNLAPGNYIVRQVLPTGYIATSTPTAVSLGAGVALTGKNFGNFPTILNGTASADTYQLRANGSLNEILVNGTLTHSITRSLLPSLAFNLLGGNDTLVVNHSAGDPTPAGGVTFDGGANSDTFDVRGAGLSDAFAINTVGAVTHGGKSVTYAASETLKLSGGTFGIAADLGSINLDVAGSTSAANFTQTQNLASLTVGTGAVVTSASTNDAAPAMVVSGVTINGGTVVIAPNGGLSGVSKFASLNIAGGGKLELHNNDLVIDYGANASPYTGILNSVRSGLITLGGSGTTGISSAAVNTQTISGTALAVADANAALVTSLSGYTAFGSRSIIVKYTWVGDANFDGQVNGSDYALADTGFSGGGTGWYYGDVNYDGTINGSDYALIDTGFSSQSGLML